MGIFKSMPGATKRAMDGRSKHTKYGVYMGMMSRCYNEDDPAYKWYGGYGVRVCEEWADPITGFWKFAEWHDENIPEGYTMDKCQTRKLYSPETVVASKFVQQALNTRQVKAHNTSGTMGVRFNEGQGWSCIMDVFGKTTFVGNYSTKEEAHEVYKSLRDFRMTDPENKEAIEELIDLYREEREADSLDKKRATNWKKTIEGIGEEWKYFDDFPQYMFSDKGRVYSLNVMKLMTVKPSGKDGTLSITLKSKNGNRKTSVSRAVADLFIPKPEGATMVSFHDADKTNAAKGNLFWTNQKEVAAKMKSQGLIGGEKHNSAKLTNEDVFFIRSDHHLAGGDYTSQQLADKYGVTTQCIRHVIKRITFKDI